MRLTLLREVEEEGLVRVELLDGQLLVLPRVAGEGSLRVHVARREGNAHRASGMQHPHLSRRSGRRLRRSGALVSFSRFLETFESVLGSFS